MPCELYLDSPTKENIVKARQGGMKVKAICDLFVVDRSTVSRLCKRQKLEGNVQRHSKSGRPPKTTIREDRSLIGMFPKDPNRTSTDNVKLLQSRFGLEVTPQTTRNRLKSVRLFARRPARKPLMVLRHRRLRLAFAKTYKHWTIDDWKKVLWSDETKINIFNPDGGKMIYRPVGTRYKLKYLRPTIKFNGGGIMVWG